MVIQKSSVGMSSGRSFVSNRHVESEIMLMTADKAATLELSEESESYVTQMRRQQQKEWNEQQEKERSGGGMALRINNAKRTNTGISMSPEFAMKLELLRKLMEGLFKDAGSKFCRNNPLLSLFSGGASSAPKFAIGGKNENASNAANVENLPSTVMTRVTAASEFIAEEETTQFSAQGMVKTADGKSISFNVNVEMSRSFYQHNQALIKEDYTLIDPLVINYDGDAAKITDQKFLFDLDSDGREEELSFTGDGSGFLAFDKNGDGAINNGSELFGTKTGNGFAELAAYDDDGNGWIDEADEVFDKLKIWTKDAQGNDRLINLKMAGVGALYLMSADTEFTMKNQESGEVNGVVRSTGVFLKENGDVGTLQHIDLAL